MTHHPLRDTTIEVYVHETGRAIALIEGYASMPIFRGANGEQARAKAEAWRSETIEKHEAGFVARKEAAEKARQVRKEKAEAKREERT